MKLLAWGANSYGQLGIGYKCEQILLPKQIAFEADGLKINKKIVSVAGGAGHTVILDDEGFIYSCGWNTKGQLGLETETVKFTKVETLSKHKIVQVSCGWDFTAALTSYGKLYVWGSNAFMQLGLPKSIKYTYQPTLLEITKIKYVSCGMRHMAIITTEGNVMICGNGNKGQLGIEDENKKIIRESDFKIIPELNNIISVACGQHHTLALKFDGNVYGWGSNKHGQLGIDPDIHNIINTPVKIPINISAQKIFTGWTHSAILNENGEIFNFGRNTYGQLGEIRKLNWIPTKLQCKPVLYLSLGAEHNLAVNSDKSLVSWGWNEHGNCGTGDTKDVKVPQNILSTNKTLYVASGTGQSFAVVQDS